MNILNLWVRCFVTGGKMGKFALFYFIFFNIEYFKEVKDGLNEEALEITNNLIYCI